MLIVQISDFHVTEPRGRVHGRIDTNRALTRMVKTINSLSLQPDLVIGSGDLTQSGSATEYEALCGILQGLKAPFVPVVGNHDRRLAFRRSFGDHGSNFGPAEFIQYSCDHGDLRLIVLDTVGEASDDGGFCEERLAWLAKHLYGGRPTILVMHHPPFLSGIGWVDPANADWSDSIGRLVEEAPHVIRMLCGHVHREVHGTWRGVTVSTCPSTAQQIALDLTPNAKAALSSEPPGFQLHHWNGRDLITHTASMQGFFKRFPLATSEVKA